MILFVNACVRSQSRTRRIAQAYLSKQTAEIREVRLPELRFPAMDEAFLAFRDDCTRRGDFSAPVFQPAKDFAAAEEILVASPFWDLSFPAVLKQYFEQINVVGLTFRYREDGTPEGLCRAKKLTYITTAGGPIPSDSFGFGYVRALAQFFYGIPEVTLIKAEGLDMEGADVESILSGVIERLP